MKIALVHDFLTQWGGGESVLRAFHRLYPKAPIYVLTYDQKLVQEFLPQAKIIPSFLQRLPGMPSAYKYYLPLLPKAIESFNLSAYDVVLSDASAFTKGVKTKKKTFHICYLHTPTRYLWSDYQSYIDSAPIPLPLIGRPIVKAITKSLRKWDLKAAKRPDYLIANSRFIAKRCEDFYRRKPDLILFPPVSTERFSVSELIDDYFLVVGRHEPYKKTDLVIEAANALGLKLKIVGGGTMIAKLKSIAGPTVEFSGRVSDSELAKIYQRAQALIFPQVEDAGIIPLEAMASGRPVIAFGAGGVLESVVPGVTGEFFSEQTVESLAKTLKNFKAEKYDPQTIRRHSESFDEAKFRAVISDTIKAEIKTRLGLD